MIVYEKNCVVETENEIDRESEFIWSPKKEMKKTFADDAISTFCRLKRMKKLRRVRAAIKAK